MFHYFAAIVWYQLPWVVALLFFFIAYLVGSISSGILACRLFGLPDPRQSGSGNPGATNVLRSGHKGAAALTLVGDLMKGLIPVLVVRMVSNDVRLIGAVMLGAFIGHLYPVYFGFKGGKGVATSVGVLLGLYWALGLTVAGVWVACLLFFRISSVAGLAAALIAPSATYFWLGGNEWVIPVLPMSFLQFWQHRENIQRLLAGTEKKIRF